MRAWRRSGGLGPAAAAGVRIIEVQTDGSDVLVVNFNGVVTWDTVGGGTLIVDGDTCPWGSQNGPTQMQAASGSGTNHNGGEAWSLPGPDPEFTPSVQVPQSGVTT